MLTNILILVFCSIVSCYKYQEDNQLCSNLISRDKVFFSQKDFFKDQNIQKYETLSKCKNYEYKKGIYADKSALSDLDTTYELDLYFKKYKSNSYVGIIGGYDIKRDTDKFREIAFMSKKLSENGYIIITEGGQGAMEAAHIGSWFAYRDIEELYDAILFLSKFLNNTKDEWYNSAYMIQEKYPRVSKGKDIVITTLTNELLITPFTSYVTIFFREQLQESLLLSSMNTIIFLPGDSNTDKKVYSSFQYMENKNLFFFDSKYWNQKLIPDIFKEKYLIDNIKEIMFYI
jgi:hypothetical protein